MVTTSHQSTWDGERLRSELAREIELLKRQLSIRIVALEDSSSDPVVADVQTLEAMSALTPGVLVGSRRQVASGAWYRCQSVTTTASIWRPCSDVWSVLDFGAIPTAISTGNGVLNSSVFADANTSCNAAGGGTIYVPSGTFELDSQWSVSDGVSVKGDGDSSVLDFSSSTGSFADSGYVVRKGTISSIGVSLSASPSKGASSITYASSPGLVSGDIFSLFDDAVNWNPAAAGFVAGEWCRVLSVSGNTVTIDSPLFDGYASATVDSYVMSPSRGSIRDIKIKGKTGSSVSGVSLIACADSIVDGLTFVDPCSTYACLSILQCVGLRATNIWGRDTQSNIGLNYAIVVGSSHDVNVSNCDLKTTRHATAVGNNGVAPYPPTRLAVFRDSIIRGIEAPGADLHGDTEYCGYQNCELPSGVVLGGDNNFVRGCTIGGSRSNGRAVWITGSRALDHNISNNKIYATQNCSGSPPALIYIAIASGASILKPGSTLMFENNDIDMGGFTGELANCIQNGSEDDVSISLIGTRVRGDLPASADESFTIGTAGSAVWRRVVVDDFESVGRNVSIRNCGAEFVKASNVIVTDCHGYCVDISGTRTVPWEKQEILVTDCIGTECGKTAFYLNGSQKAKSSITVSNCIGLRNGRNNTGTDDSRCSFYLAGFTTATLRSCTYGDDHSTPLQTRSLYLSDITNMIENDNFDVSGASIGRTESSITNHYRRFIRPTAYTTGNFALHASWGSTASVAVATGSNDNRGEITVTSSGTGQGANPTIVMTYSYGFNTAPLINVYRNGGSQLTVPIYWTIGGSSITITFAGTPVDTETYTFGWELAG